MECLGHRSRLREGMGVGHEFDNQYWIPGARHDPGTKQLV